MGRDDKTLLARMGFQDEDRRDPVHDLACAYLAEAPQAQRILELQGQRQFDARHFVELAPYVELEAVAKTGSGYVVGFIDLLVERVIRDAEQVCPGPWCCTDPSGHTGARPPQTYRSPQFGRIIVEVKIARTPVGELLRQLKVYEACKGPGATLVAALAYELSANERSMLTTEAVKVIRLGDGFREWRDQHREAAKPDAEF